jgi:hypothetical protein
MDKISRKYNSIFRKNLKQKILNLSEKNDFISIYKILISDTNTKISINNNGIYFNLNLLSDICIDQINIFLQGKNIITNEPTIINKIKYEPYSKSCSSESEINYGQKLSNQEKIIIKKCNQ